MEFPMSSPNASPWNPNVLPIEPAHGFPNDQSPSNPIEATWGDGQCITHKALPWCSYGAVPMQFHGSSIWASQWHTHRALRVDFPMSSTQCKSMESHCITHRTMPWNAQCTIHIQSHRSHMVIPLCITHKACPWCSYGAIPMQFHGSSMWASQCLTHKGCPWNSQ